MAKRFCDTTLTRDLFAVADRLVSDPVNPFRPLQYLGYTCDYFTEIFNAVKPYSYTLNNGAFYFVRTVVVCECLNLPHRFILQIFTVNHSRTVVEKSDFYVTALVLN